MIFFICILTYSIFIFKPDLGLNTSNKLGLTDYKINFEEIKLVSSLRLDTNAFKLNTFRALNNAESGRDVLDSRSFILNFILPSKFFN